MRKLIILIFIFIIASAFAKSNMDSLYAVWKDKTELDSNRAFAYAAYIREGFLFTDADSALTLTNILYNFSEKRNLKTGKADALNYKGLLFLLRGDYPKALDYFDKSFKLSEELGDSKRSSISLSNIAVIYDNLGNYPKALEYNEKSLEKIKSLDDKKRVAFTLNNIGIIYDNMGENLKAIDYYKRSLEIHKAISDKRGIATNLTNLGMIYHDLENYEKAISYYKRSSKIYEIIDDIKNIAYSQNNIADIYVTRGKFDIALRMYEKSVELFTDLKYKKGIANTMVSVGDLFKEKKDYERALHYYKRSIKEFGELGKKFDISSISNNIGDMQYIIGNIKEALINCKNGYNIAKEIGAIELQRSSCECLYKAYKKNSDKSNALVYLEQMVVLDDSIQIEETTKELMKIEFREKSKADSIKQEEARLRTKYQYESERNIAIGIGVLFFLVAGGFLSRIMYIKKSKKVLEKERDLSEKLLLNILPSEIAKELKENGKSATRNYENVTIIFTDFKEFTQAAENVEATELIEEVNQCFLEFDRICEQYNVEKIKTIGDSYLAVGGLPVPYEESTINSVLACLDMNEYIVKRQKENSVANKLFFEMRIGVHTGSVVAGIVGEKKFQYDIWGDSVNTASRMESSGEEGKVNISESTYVKIKDDERLIFTPRGKVIAKGKGEIDMYFVEYK